MEAEEVTLGCGPHVIEGGYEASHQPRRATQMFFDQDQRHRWRLSEIDTPPPNLTPLPIIPPTFAIPKFECEVEVVRFHPQHTREWGTGWARVQTHRVGYTRLKIHTSTHRHTYKHRYTCLYTYVQAHKHSCTRIHTCSHTQTHTP